MDLAATTLVLSGEVGHALVPLTAIAYENVVELVVGVRCANVNGFFLHTQIHVGGHQRDRLEQLVKDPSRPPLALDCLAQRDDGDLI